MSRRLPTQPSRMATPESLAVDRFIALLIALAAIVVAASN